MQRMMVFFLASIAAFSAMSASAIAADTKLTIYEHDKYGGRMVVLDDSAADLRSLNMNNVASSLRVSGERAWQICEEPNFGGRCMTVAADEYLLSEYDFDNKMSSARPVQIKLYEDANYGQPAGTLQRSEPDLRASYNDRISSANGVVGRWELCEHINYGGHCFIVDSNTPTFPAGFNDVVSSVRVLVDGRVRVHEITVFEHTDYQGASMLFVARTLSVRDRGKPTLPTNFNDRISSIRIRGGAWVFCEHADYQGQCRIYRRDQPNLEPQEFNDLISSFHLMVVPGH